MAVGPEGGPIASHIGNGSKARGRRRILQVPAALHAVRAGMAHLAPDPHPEDADARGPARGVRAVLLFRCVPRVLATSQGRRVSRARRVPAIGGERPAHEGHAARAFAGRPGRAGNGDGPATGIGAARVVEFDPAADARRVGAMGTESHAEGRPVVRHPARTVQGFDRQVVDRTGQGLVVHLGGRPDQVLVQPGSVSDSGIRHL